MSSLLDRFTDPADGHRRVIQQLLRQETVANSPPLAEEFASAGAPVFFAAGEHLIEDRATTTGLFLLLAGEVVVEINGRRVATRSAGQHVGEMAAIDPAQTRSATVRATKETVAIEVDEPSVTRIASSHPELWRRLALELSNRLRQRAEHVETQRGRPEVFIGSASSEHGLGIARAFQGALGHDPWTTRIWTDGTFGAGKTPIESLMAQLNTIDFAVLVITPDDLLTSGDETQPTARDNVIFELGLAMGALGRDRVFMLQERNRQNVVRVPTDLTGVEPLGFASGDEASLTARLGPAATEFRLVVRRLGGR